MSNTFSQIYIHVVFAVQNRKALIKPTWEDELFKYITGIVQNKGQKMLAINGTSNHIHFLIGMKPSCCLSDLVREVKKSSNSFVKEKHFTAANFNWQEGLVLFRIVNHISIQLSITSKTKSSITRRKHLKMNILPC
ncbi:MAG: transposase [Paludibacter sp.]|jgi:REP element-mobilizing transposase RayT|nr:transposase [Paludibacter sp.]